MTSWRHHLRRARFAMTMTAGVLLIGAAVAVGVVQLMLPLATHYPNFIARQLSDRLHRPVKFAAIASTWQPSGPLLTINDLTLGPGHPGGQSITLPHAALKFDFGAWLQPSHRWITLRLSGMNLRVVHSAAGWDVVGFAASANAAHASLESLPVDLDLRDLHVDIVDEITRRSWSLLAPRLRVVNVGAAARFGGSVQQLGTHQGVTVSGRVDQTSHDYDLYATTNDLDLAEAVRGLGLHGYAVRSGAADVEAWLHWRHGRVSAAALRYALTGLSATGPDNRAVDLAAFSGVFSATRVADGWNVAWRGPGKTGDDIDASGGLIAQVRGQAGKWRVSAAARHVDLAPWLSLLAMAPQLPQNVAAWVAHAQPHLTVDTAAATWQQGGHYAATVRFSQLHAGADARIPGVALARGIVRADDRAIALSLPQQPATLAVTDVFRKPFVFRKFGGDFVAWQQDGLWNIGLDDVHFDTGSLAGDGRAHLVWLGHGHQPFLSAYGELEHAKIPDATMFWPYRSMSPHLVAWLDHGLVAGDVVAGGVAVRGNLDDWPFLQNQGRFEATGTVKNATFDFADGWPRATEVDASLDFVDNHMDITATHVKTQGVTVTHAVASIPDLGHGVLDLDIQGGGTGAQLLGFVRHSPVGAHAQDVLSGLTVGGTGKFGVKLSIPLGDAANFNLAGNVDLAKADVKAPKWNLELQGLSGPLSINRTGFSAHGLTALFRGAPATLSMALGDGNVADPADIVEASMDTNVSAQTLVQGYPDLGGLVAHASGVAPFHIGVKVLAGSGGAPATPILHLQSSLAGIALDFPAPLNKAAATTLPLDLTLQLPPAGAPLTVALGDVLQVRGRLADPARNLPTALAMNFGAALPTSVPASGLVVGGHAKRLDVSGWIQQALGETSGAAFPQLNRAQVSADDAQVFGTSLGPLHFTFDSGAQDDSVGFDGPAVKGTLQLPVADLMTRGISAHFDHLYWPEPPAPEKSATPQPPSLASPIAPTAVPPLHVAIGALQLGSAHLGATTFESAPTLTGMRVSRFDSKGVNFTIQAHGDWNGTRADSQSHFVVDIASKDFGKTLDAFGFSGLLAGGEDSHLHIDGTWPGAPSGFSLGWMTGDLSIKVGEGRILAVKPGLGRLLGLLSLRELPSRLMFHFGDVFKSGFGFDHASANFILKNGNAYTRDMSISAPAAKITMIGRTGFRAHDFDLTVDVTPHLGGTLPVVGAVIGGPVGAAAGLVVQGLLGKGINKAAGSIYSVTGTWDKPKIVTIASVPPPTSALGGLPLSATSTAAPASAASVAAPAPATSAMSAPSAASSAAPASAASAASAPPAAAASAAIPAAAASGD